LLRGAKNLLQLATQLALAPVDFSRSGMLMFVQRFTRQEKLGMPSFLALGWSKPHMLGLWRGCR